MKKLKYILPFMVLASCLSFAQEADDGFIVPLNEDFSKVPAEVPSAPADSGSSSAVKQGAWIEVTSSNKSLIRDIATGKKKGYEFDNSHFLTNMNWWFWGDISPKFHLDAEVSVWDCDKTLYQANSYADNVPDVTWGDGLQSLASMPFSFLYNLNDEGVGAFNKMGFTLINPYIEAKFGYGDLKANGMIDFDGIYHVIDRWDFVDKGFTELSLGKDLRQAGNFTFNATAAFSMMRGTYGLYDLLDIKYGDEKSPLFRSAFTFGSYTTEDELFRYNENNINAVSAYLEINPSEKLKLEFHALGTFGTETDFGKDSSALAVRAGWNAEKWNVRVMESVASKNVNSVWGSDGTDYDDINANTSTTQADLYAEITPAFAAGLDETVTYILEDEESASKHNQFKGYTSFRTQPYFDIDLSGKTGKDIMAGVYGLIEIDALTSNTNDDGDTKTNFRGAGLELKLTEVVPSVKKLTFDYALGANAKWQMDAAKIDSNNDYDCGEMFHSVMLKAEVSDSLTLTAAGLYRDYKVNTKITEQPLGFALGFIVNKTPLPGHPKFWAHFTYGMDPYEDKNYELFRADDPTNKSVHRTYLLNTLDDYSKGTNTASFVRLGLIWDL
ncbi:MAG: hypothetical protein J6Y93_05420 [Treponema sp.]|nr:hypothetical protein [Treponema sp.]